MVLIRRKIVCMSNPTTRVLAALELLQTHGAMTGAEMARRLGVETRTVRRYIVALEALGIPVMADRGRDGGYRLMHGFKLPPMMFTNDEAMAVSLGLLASRRLGLAEAAPAGESALAKLERVMPQNLRQRVRAIGETVALDLSQPSSLGDNRALGALSAAAQAQQRVRMAYLSADGAATERDVDVYGLVFRGGHWYAVGHCHLRRDLRSFRLDRVSAVAALPVSFGRPQDFDALAYLSEAIASLPRGFAVTVLLRTDLETARRHLFDWMGLLSPVEEGVLLHSQASDLEWMARELARLPFGFAIQSPPELETILAEHARALLGQLEGGAAGSA